MEIVAYQKRRAHGRALIFAIIVPKSPLLEH